MEKQITIKPLGIRDIPEVSDLHRTLINSPGSLLGNSYIQKVYEIFLTHSSTHIVLGAYANDHVIAALSATKNIQETDYFMQKHIPSFFIPLVRNIVTRKITLKELYTHQKVHYHISQLATPHSIYISGLFVDKEYQRRGIASDLINKLSANNTLSTLLIDTQTTNERALLFYESIGFSKVRIIGDHVILRK